LPNKAEKLGLSPTGDEEYFYRRVKIRTNAWMTMVWSPSKDSKQSPMFEFLDPKKYKLKSGRELEAETWIVDKNIPEKIDIWAITTRQKTEPRIAQDLKKRVILELKIKNNHHTLVLVYRESTHSLHWCFMTFLINNYGTNLKDIGIKHRENIGQTEQATPSPEIIENKRSMFGDLREDEEGEDIEESSDEESINDSISEYSYKSGSEADVGKVKEEKKQQGREKSIRLEKEIEKKDRSIRKLEIKLRNLEKEKKRKEGNRKK